MECFIVYKLNETSYREDTKLLPYFGPYAAALSQIIGTSTFDQDVPMYRGISLLKEDFLEYVPGK